MNLILFKEVNYKIYQHANRAYILEDYDSSLKHGFDFDKDYKCVCEDKIKVEYDSKYPLDLKDRYDCLSVLSKIYLVQKTVFPNAVKPHSLDVGDIVELENGSQWFFNTIGWLKIK